MPEYIQSKNNAEIKFIKSLKTKKKRHQSRFFLVEGIRSISEAIRSGQAEKVFVTENIFFEHEALLGPIEHSIVSEPVMESIASTKTPPGAVALCPFLHNEFEHLINSGDKYVFLDNISDPGNMGTLVRTAHAAGIDALFVSSNCADIYNPKAIRATMGSIFYVPLAIGVEAEALLEKAANMGIELLGLTADAGNSIYVAKISGPTVLLIGSETEGLSPSIRSSVRNFARIPMVPTIDSLNAAVAGSIAMMEFQRRGL